MNDIVRQTLIGAGWSPGRDVSPEVDRWASELEPEFEMFEAARTALREFGGIEVAQRGPGINMPRESFVIDPLKAWGEEDRFADFEHVIGQRLYPLGLCGAGHYFLAIAEDGSVLAVMGGIDLVGGSAHEAIENLIVGRRGSAVRPGSADT